MANNVNILKASFNGKVGAVYGDNSRGVAKVKAIPFSHTPTAETVKAQCRAFECLNRFSAGIAKNFWKFLSLSDKKLLRHNAVAKWLAIGVTDKQWQPSLLGETIGSGNNIEITKKEVDRINGSFEMSISVSGDNIPNNNNVALYLALVDDQGKVIFAVTPTGATYSFKGVARLFSERRYFVTTFLSVQNSVNKKWKTSNFVYAETNYI